MTDPSPLLTQEQAAAYLQVGVKTIRAWTREGRLPVLRRGRLIRYPKEAVDRALAAMEPEQWETRAMLRRRAG